jgi:beta-glucosidase
MSAMNFIGTTPAMGCDELLNQILRGEWGFRGMVLTDTFNGRGAQYSDRFIRNGNDAMLTNGDFTYNFIQDQQSATSVLAMRQAAKNILYTTANSRLYQGEAGTQQTSSLSQILMVVNICAAVLLVLIEAAALLLYRKRSRETNG